MKRLLFFLLTLSAMLPWAANAQTLTVFGEPTTSNEYVPFYGFYADATQQNQMIYPASELTAMVGMEITEMVFYIDDYYYNSSIGNWIVSLGETSATTLSSLDNTTALTEVYSGQMTFNSDNTLMTVTLDNGYTYNGGNLLVEFNHPVAAGYSHYYFLGVEATGASYCYGSQQDFLPKVTFSYQDPNACHKPRRVSVNYTTTNSAGISWTGTSDSYTVQYRVASTEQITDEAFFDDFENGLDRWTLIVNEEGSGWRTYDATNFTDLTNYSGNNVAMVRSYENSYNITADNWMISPQITIQPTMTYWAHNDGRSDHLYDETYDVCVSTRTNSTSDFVVVQSFTTTPNEWERITIDLSAYAGQQGYVAFHHHDEDKDLLLIDDVFIGTIESAPAGAWQSQSTEGNETEIELDGLTVNTTYEYQVMGVCVDSESDWTDIGTFTTLSACTAPTRLSAEVTGNTVELNWTGASDSYNVQYRISQAIISEDFEGDAIPEGWTTIDYDEDGENWLTLSEIPTTYSYYSALDLSSWAHSGSNAATSPSYVNGFGSLESDHWLITPQLNLQGTLRFYAASTYEDPDSYEVLLSTSGNNPNDFIITLQPMQEATYGEWDEVNINLSSYAGQQGYIAIRHVSEDKYFLVIDDFSIAEVGPWQSATVSNNTLTINGLDPETRYEWRVRAINSECDGGMTEWSASDFFTTDEILSCTAITITETEPYTQDFENPVVTSAYSSTEGLEVPECWENPYTTGYATCSNPHIIFEGDSYNYAESGQVLYFYGSGSNYVTLPEFTNPLNELQITFKWATEGSSSGTLTLGYITDEDEDYSTFTAIETYPASLNSQGALIQADPVFLNNVPAEATRLAFRWYYGGWYGSNIDDIEVSLLPSCLPATDISTTELSSSSATLTWTNPNPVVDGETSYIICYGETATFDLDDATTYETVTSNTTSATIDVTQNTDYTVTVMVVCSSTDEADWATYNFTSPCDAITTFPFIEGFESTTFPPNCWDKIEEDEDYPWYLSSRYHSGSQCANSSYFGDNYLITPPITLPSDEVKQLKFWSYNQWPGDFVAGNNSVLISTTGRTAADFTTTLWAAESVVSEWVADSVSLESYAGQTIYIAFKYAGYNGNAWNLDDVSIDAIPEAAYTITITQPTGGAVSAQVGDEDPFTTTHESTVGAEVHLSNTPNDGYLFDHYVVTDDNGEVSLINDNYFIMPASDVNVTALFVPDTFNVTFVTNGGTWTGEYINRYYYGEAPTLPTSDKIEFTGHTFEGWFDNSDLEGDPLTAVPADAIGDVTYYAKWTANEYLLTIVYQYSDESTAAPSFNSMVTYNTGYSVTSPTIEGYTPDQTEVSGTMPAGPVTVTVTYSNDIFSLTIHYQYTDGTEAHADVANNYAYGSEYNVASPAITTYMPDPTVVSGTMGNAAVEVTVTYTQIVMNEIENVTVCNSGEVNAITFNSSVNLGEMSYAWENNETGINLAENGNGNIEAFEATNTGTEPLVATLTVTPTCTYNGVVVEGVPQTFTITVNPKLSSEFNDVACDSYYWTDADTTIVDEGLNDYVHVFTSQYNCDSVVTLHLTLHKAPVDLTADVTNNTSCDPSQLNGALTVTTPIGDYEYSIDNLNWQTEVEFTGLAANSYTLYARPVGSECAKTAVFIVGDNIVMPTATAAASQSFFCTTNAISLSGVGSSTGDDYSYIWAGPNSFSSNNLNVNVTANADASHSGTYTLVVLNNVTHCSSEATIEVVVNTPGTDGYVFEIITSGDAYANINEGETEATVVLADPTVNHFLSGDCNWTMDNDVQATYDAVGDYTITWTATDDCGNTATATQTLHVTQTSCGTPIDGDNNSYPTVHLGGICWMAANLRTTRYADGEEVPNVMKYQSNMYPNAEANAETYGMLYDWYDALRVDRPTRGAIVQGVCPNDWRLPNEDDFDAIESIDLHNLRSTTGWLRDAGDNSTGFNLLPAGQYNADRERYENLLGNAYFWSADAVNDAQGRCHMADCNCYLWYEYNSSKNYGYSVRCVKNN